MSVSSGGNQKGVHLGRQVRSWKNTEVEEQVMEGEPKIQNIVGGEW